MCDAMYCRIKPLVAVEKKVRRHKVDIAVVVELGTGNDRVEAINNKIKVTVRMGYGFRNTDNLIGVLILRCSDSRPTLPGRAEESTKKEAASMNFSPTETAEGSLFVGFTWRNAHCARYGLIPRRSYADLVPRSSRTAYQDRHGNRSSAQSWRSSGSPSR